MFLVAAYALLRNWKPVKTVDFRVNFSRLPQAMWKSLLESEKKQHQMLAFPLLNPLMAWIKSQLIVKTDEKGRVSCLSSQNQCHGNVTNSDKKFRKLAFDTNIVK